MKIAHFSGISSSSAHVGGLRRDRRGVSDGAGTTRAEGLSPMALGSAWQRVARGTRMRCTVGAGRRAQGFTLVELLIVVAMIGVLAALAIMGYRKYLNSAGASEAKAVIQGIRAQEESYRAETLTYLKCSSSPTSYYPMATPSSKKWAWNNPGHGDYNCWKTLNVQTDGPVRFGYAVVAGLPGESIPAVSQFANPPTWPNPTTDPWYVVTAAGDRDDDGKQALFVSSSYTGEIYGENDDE